MSVRAQAVLVRVRPLFVRVFLCCFICESALHSSSGVLRARMTSAPLQYSQTTQHKNLISPAVKARSRLQSESYFLYLAWGRVCDSAQSCSSSGHQAGAAATAGRAVHSDICSVVGPRVRRRRPRRRNVHTYIHRTHSLYASHPPHDAPWNPRTHAYVLSIVSQ